MTPRTEHTITASSSSQHSFRNPVATKKLTTRHLIGRVAECLVEAYAVISSGGLLDGFRPGVDMDHKDLIFDEVGGYANAYTQVKCATKLSNRRRVHCRVQIGAAAIPSDPRFAYVFCLLDLKAMDLTKMWVVPSLDFNRLAYKTQTASGRPELIFEANPEGDAKWDRFLVNKQSLGPRLLQIARTPAKSKLRSLDLRGVLVLRAA
jgi:hypothetical protein